MDIFVRFLASGLMIALGLGVGVWVIRRWKTSWRLFWIGCWTFIGSQVLHIPFNIYILDTVMASQGLGVAGAVDWQGRLLTGVFLGLSAGLFEELARYAVYKTWLKDARRWEQGLAIGAGHGGIEAVLVGGLGVLTLFNLVGVQEADLVARLTPEELEVARMQIASYWSAPWYLVMLGVAERVFAVVFHLSASLMVLRGVRERKLHWLLAAIGWHTMLDAAAVYGVLSWGVLAAEALIGGFGLASFAIILYLREAVSPEEVDPSSQAPPALKLEQVEFTKEQIEESRYG